MASLFSLLCNSDTNQTGIDFEISIYYLINAFLQSIEQNLQSAQKLNGLILKIVSLILRIIRNNENKFVITLTNPNITNMIKNIETIVKKVRELLSVYDKDNSFISDDMLFFKNVEEFFESLGFDLNFVLANINRFSHDSMREQVNETINECFVIKYVSDKYLSILANLIVDEIDYKTNFEKKIVMESLNGFLILEKEEFTLYAFKSFFKINENKENKIFINNKPKITNNNFIFHIFELRSQSDYSSFFTKIKFRIVKDEKFDPLLILTVISCLYRCKAYRAVLPLLIHLISEFDKNMTVLKEPENEAYLVLYEFLLLLEIYLLCFIEDFTLALIEINKLSAPTGEYSEIQMKILLGVCLSKLRFSDLSVLYFESIITKITPHILNESLLQASSKSEDIKPEKTLQSSSQVAGVNTKERDNYKKILFSNEKLPESNIIILILLVFFTPTLLLLSSLNMMKLNAVKRFQDEVKENCDMCFHCKVSIFAENDKTKAKSEDYKAVTQIYPCLKCRRAYFCSSQCLKNSKNIHSIICEKYFQNIENVNKIVEEYLTTQQENI